MASAPLPPEQQPWLILMVKAPVAGQVKTRLAAEIGEEAATHFYRLCVEYLARTLFLHPARRWRPVVAYAPAEAEGAMRSWLRPWIPCEAGFLPQPEGDLGLRLEAVFREAFRAGSPAALAIGGDCPAIAPEEIGRALNDLGDFPLALGPTKDGGYWLIGMNGPHWEIFRQMPWSQPQLTRSTLDRARSLGLAVALQPSKADVDTKADLLRMKPILRELLGRDWLAPE